MSTNPYFTYLPWMEQALCTPDVGDLFFPDEKDGSKAAQAKRVCRGIKGKTDPCPVLAQCLEYGLSENHGIWGGTTPRDRAKLRRGAAA